MSQFTIGSRVRCITSTTNGAVKVGQEYVVKSTGVLFGCPSVTLEGRPGAYVQSRFELVVPAPAYVHGPIGPVDVRSLRQGDKVTVFLTYDVTSDPDSDGDVSVETSDHSVGAYLIARREYVGTVQRAPRPLAVGDRVTCPTKSGPGVIEGINGEFAWVRFGTAKAPTTRHIAKLKRAQ